MLIEVKKNVGQSFIRHPKEAAQAAYKTVLFRNPQNRTENQKIVTYT